eukprot:XP_010656732.1 PREDICTED: uncharacterized protein LOC104880757 [Vitis vinifera]
MDDRKVTPISGSTELIDFRAFDQPREIRIDSSLSPDERSRLIDLLRSYLDVFAWSYEDMPGLNPSIVQHRLPILPHARPVKQKLRRLHPQWSLQVKEKIQKQLGVGFLSVNARATYQRVATALFHDMMHRDVEVYVDDMIVKSRDRTDHSAALQRFFERIRQFRLRLNPKKCTFGSAFEKVKEYLLSPPVLVPSTPGRPLLLYLSVSDMALGCMLAQLDDSRKELVLTGWLMRWLVLLTEFDIRYVTQKSVKGSIVADHLASLSVFDDKPIEDDFLDEQFVSMTSIVGWQLYFDGVANQSRFGIGILLISPQGDHIPRSVRLTFSDHHRLMNNIVEYEACIIGLETTLDLGVRQLEIHGDSNLVIQQIQGIWRTRDEKLKPYHAYLDLLVDRFDELRYIHLHRVENQFAGALATLASMIEIPTGVTVLPLLIETRSVPAYCCLIGDIEDQDELPWYHDIYQFLACGTHLEAFTAKDRRTLRQLATRFVICGDALYRRSPNGLLLLCLDHASADRVMREVHAGVCGPHMGGHMLARKIMRTSYY